MKFKLETIFIETDFITQGYYDSFVFSFDFDFYLVFLIPSRASKPVNRFTGKSLKYCPKIVPIIFK